MTKKNTYHENEELDDDDEDVFLELERMMKHEMLYDEQMNTIVEIKINVRDYVERHALPICEYFDISIWYDMLFE